MNEVFVNNFWLIWPIMAWSLVWKGWALWIAAQRRHWWWFLAVLLINTVGILEISYIFYFSKKKFKVLRVFTQVFTASAAIIEKDNKILLVKEGQAGADTGMWNQPGGWIEIGESPIETVIHEVKDETGLEFEPTALLGIYSLQKQKKKSSNFIQFEKFVFKGKVVGGDIDNRDKKEISEVRWFSKEEIEAMGKNQLRYIDIKKQVADYFAGKEYSLDIIEHTVCE